MAVNAFVVPSLPANQPPQHPCMAQLTELCTFAEIADSFWDKHLCELENYKNLQKSQGNF
jgi:hypothetical protein